jgi:hypothetical protein
MEGRMTRRMDWLFDPQIFLFRDSSSPSDIQHPAPFTEKPNSVIQLLPGHATSLKHTPTRSCTLRSMTALNFAQLLCRLYSSGVLCAALEYTKVGRQQRNQRKKKKEKEERQGSVLRM